MLHDFCRVEFAGADRVVAGSCLLTSSAFSLGVTTWVELGAKLASGDRSTYEVNLLE